MSPNCPFCTLDTVRILEEREHCYVMLSDPHLVPGHTLVIPRRHVLKPSELEPSERRELFDTAIEYQERIIASYSTGCDMRQNYRPFIKQNQLKVDHVHIHLLPRELEDEIFQKVQTRERELFHPLPDKEIAQFRELLKK